MKPGSRQSRKLLLWDIDGTILHTGKAGEAALGHAMETLHGVAKGLQGLEIAGRTDKWIVEQLLAREGLAHGEREIARFLDVLEFEFAKVVDIVNTTMINAAVISTLNILSLS